MPLVLTHEGGFLMWENALNLVSYGVATIHLFGKSYAPQHSDTWMIWVTNELPLAAGYAPIPLTNTIPDWTFTDNSQGKTATFKPVSWSFSAALTVYGYFVSWDTPQIAWIGEQFPVAYTFPPVGGPFTFTLSLPLISIP